MKTNMKKIVIAMTVVVIALLVSGCGKNEQEPNLYGYAGQPCQNMMNGFNGYGPYPQVGQNLKGNYPIMGYNGQCYPWNQFNSMYNQYQQNGGLPWNQFQNSPYSNFQVYYPGNFQPSTGQMTYSANSAVNMNANWVNAGDFFTGAPGFGGYPYNKWVVRFDYWRNN